MVRRWVVVLAILFSPLFSSGARADLAGDVRAILRDKYFNNAKVGIVVARLGPQTGQTQLLFRSDSDVPLIPASNLKLVTTSAFLDQLGGDFRFRTVLLAREGDLFLVGDGDPTLGDFEMLKKVGWNVDTVFRAWAEELRKRGVTTVRDVSVDDSVFDEEFIHPSWLSRYAHLKYSAQVGGVNLNGNCVDVWIRATSPGELVNYALNPDTRYVSVRNQCVTGTASTAGGVRSPGKNDVALRGQVTASLGEPVSVPIHDPPLYAATVLAETLGNAGISVTGSVLRDREASERHAADPTGWAVIAALETKVSTVIDRANKDSNNLYAEALCKRLGHHATRQAGSWPNGAAAIGHFLTRIGVPESQFNVDDGCGLSRKNAISASALLEVLAFNFHGSNREVFMNSLAVAGADGTFEKRFRNDQKGRVFGKSGYVNSVSALSGYLKAKDEQWYAFSILMNDLPLGTNNVAKEMQEKIIAAIDANVGK